MIGPLSSCSLGLRPPRPSSDWPHSPTGGTRAVRGWELWGEARESGVRGGQRQQSRWEGQHEPGQGWEHICLCSMQSFNVAPFLSGHGAQGERAGQTTRGSCPQTTASHIELRQLVGMCTLDDTQAVQGQGDGWCAHLTDHPTHSISLQVMAGHIDDGWVVGTLGDVQVMWGPGRTVPSDGKWAGSGTHAQGDS